MDDFRRHQEQRLPSNRSFAWVMTTAFALLGAWPLVKGGQARGWAFAIGGVFLLAGALFPAALTPLNRAWMGLAHLLSRIVNPVIMAILFYGVFTPLAVVGRWMGRDPLRLRFDKQASSYWITRPPGELKPESMRNQF